MYVKLFGVVVCLIFLVFLLFRIIYQVMGLYVNFLFLGLGFMLVEFVVIVRLVLVVGSIWVMNVVVFGVVLFIIFGVNYLVYCDWVLSFNVAWVGVFVGLLLNYWVVPVELLVLFFLICTLFVGLFVVALVFFAVICFSCLF